MTAHAPSPLTPAQLRTVVLANPFNRWLGLDVQRLDEREIELRVPGRAEFIGTQALQRVHGGILGSLVDTGCGYAVMAATGQGVSTVNLQVDFHRAASLGELRVTGRLLHRGSRICSAEAFIHDAEGLLVASGRGTLYITRHRHPALAGTDQHLETPDA
ncbi:PaaI family thioesterase [Pseudomonas sp. S60]|uniref:PaaI family thioesterase n=1 Tax=Pseudomonas sp. S60 TaxID=211124 RepID=UPI0019141080|nr:PaaI family thioesterase [Pseudomonas sp. S60]MBK5010876.1 PaaI family thioesterase [Pseudomonas sp. S60]